MEKERQRKGVGREVKRRRDWKRERRGRGKRNWRLSKIEINRKR